MKEKFVSRFIVENGKKKEFIEVHQTKIGNRYIFLQDATTYRAIPYECLMCFCSQFPQNQIPTDEEIKRMKEIPQKIEAFIKELEKNKENK